MYRMYKRTQHFRSTGVPKLSPGYGPDTVSKKYEALKAFNKNNANKILLSIENVGNRTTNEKKQVRKSYTNN